MNKEVFLRIENYHLVTSLFYFPSYGDKCQFKQKISIQNSYHKSWTSYFIKFKQLFLLHLIYSYSILLLFKNCIQLNYTNLRFHIILVEQILIQNEFKQTHFASVLVENIFCISFPDFSILAPNRHFYCDAKGGVRVHSLF